MCLQINRQIICVVLLMFIAKMVYAKCTNTFIISSSQMQSTSGGALIRREPIDSLNECLAKCDLDTECTHVRFDIATPQSTVAAQCSLWHAGINAQITNNQTQPMYYAQKMCMENAHDKRNVKTSKCVSQWTYEKYANVQLRPSLQHFLLNSSKQSTMTLCLQQCNDYILETTKNVAVNGLICRAVVFTTATSQCDLLTIAPNSVRDVYDYFEPAAVESTRPADETSLYERACVDDDVSLIDRKCDFIPVSGAGMVDIFDDRFSRVVSVDECRQYCVQWAKGAVCRSYTYDRNAQQCYISHVSSRTLKRQIRDMRNEHLSMGDLDDCIDFSLRCQQTAMIVRGRSLRLLNGVLKPRSYRDMDNSNTNTACQLSVRDAYDFQSRIDYDLCGTKREADTSTSYYTNTLFLKDGATELVTIRDKMVQAVCKITRVTDLSVNYTLSVDGNGSSYFLPNHQQSVIIDQSRNQIPVAPSVGIPIKPNSVAAPQFSLDILDTHHRPAESITAGDAAYIVISAQHNRGVNLQSLANDDAILFHVTDLTAEDQTGRTVMRLYRDFIITLYDDNGCSLNASVAAPLSRQADGSLTTLVHTDYISVPGNSRLTFKALIEPCASTNFVDCPLVGVQPNSYTLYVQPCSQRSHNQLHRRRRSLANDVGRHFYLSTETFQIQSSPPLSVQPRSVAVDEEVEHPPAMSAPGVASVHEYSIQHDEDASDPLVHLDPPSTLHLCLNTQRLSCLFTILLIALQAVMMLLCVVLVYCYWRYVRRMGDRVHAVLYPPTRMLHATPTMGQAVAPQHQHEPPPDYCSVVGEQERRLPTDCSNHKRDATLQHE